MSTLTNVESFLAQEHANQDQQCGCNPDAVVPTDGIDYSEGALKETFQDEESHDGDNGDAYYEYAASRMLCVDLRYEHFMQEQLCAAMEGGSGHYFPRAFVMIGGRELALEPIGDGLRVHTYIRNTGTGHVLAHSCHPFIAMIHLLKEATVSSDVYVSAPFITDIQFLDELAYYAKPVVNGGRDLTIKILISPHKWVVKEIKRYLRVGVYDRQRRQERETALNRLQFRFWGEDPPYDPDIPYTKCQSMYSHSKSIVTSAGAMMGSYNFTIASRGCHYEDGFVMPPGDQVDSFKADLEMVWNAGVAVDFRTLVVPQQKPPKAPRFQE